MAKKQSTDKEKDIKPTKEHKSLWRRILSAIGLVLLVVIVITVVVGGILDLADLRVRKTSSQTNSFAFTGSTLNLLNLTAGTVNIERGQPGTIVIERTVTQGIRKVSTSEHANGNTFVVQQDNGCGAVSFGVFGMCTSNFTIKVPANIAVTMRDSGANITINNIEGNLTIQTDGKIAVDHVTDKDMTLHSNDSDVTATNIQASSLDASTGDGKVNIDHANVPDVTLSSNDSDVSVANTKSTSVNATSGDGKIMVSRVTGKLVLRSSNSDVTGTDITSSSVDATSGDGKVSLVFSAAPNTVVAHSDNSDVSIIVPHNNVAYKTNATSNNSTTTVNIKTDPDNTKNTINATSGDGKVAITY